MKEYQYLKALRISTMLSGCKVSKAFNEYFESGFLLCRGVQRKGNEHTHTYIYIYYKPKV